MKKLTYYIDSIRFVLGIFKMVMNPKDISAIFRVKSFREHKSLQNSLRTMYSDPEISNLIKTRYLAPKPYDLNELIKFPENTLGRVYAEHMIKHNLEVVFYPEMDSKIDDDINYMRMRARQTHDIHHVILGYPAEDYGEVAISAFYFSQNQIPLSGLIIGSAFFRVVLKQPERIEELMTSITKGWAMGKKSKHVLGVKWEEYFDKPIDEVRKLMNIDSENMLIIPENELKLLVA
ncbi:MAG: Coq4 family protein [Candidatus Sericytochromatia bacterium]